MFAFLFKTAFRLLGLLPLGALHGLGALLGRLTYAASAQYATRTWENLRQAGITEDEARYRSMLSATIAEAGKGIAELAWVWGRPYDEVLGKVRECVGLEHIIAAQERGKGIIFLTPHLGCFEISALYAARRVPITVLYRPPKLGFLEGVMRGGRERGQAKLAKADVSGVRLLYKALRRGEAIGLLPDQVPSRGEGEWAEFFGRPAYTMTLAGRLAESSGATVLIAYSERLPRGQGYVIHVEPLALDFAASVPQQVNAALERVIRACPAQYLWSYNRYKTPRGVSAPTTPRTHYSPLSAFHFHAMMTRIGIFMMWLLHFLPLPLLARVGNALGLLLYWFAAERRHVAMTNLRLCFPELSEAGRRVLARKNFQAFARSFLERGILWWGSASRIQGYIRVEGLEHYTAAQARGPVILLAPHFVALDVGGSWMIQHVDLVSVYSSQKNPLFHKMLLHGRSRFGAQKLYVRQQGLRPVIKAMRERRPFYYLPDQDLATKDGVFVPFFGVLAATLTTVPRLAEMTGAQVVPCISKLLPGGKGYEVRFYPAWENYPSGDLVADTRRMNGFIEQRVREMPEQYFWLHKRFKTRPEGEKKFY